MKRLTYVECDIDRCGLTYGTSSSAWVKRQSGLNGSVDTVSHNGTDATWLSAIGSTHRTSGTFHFEIYLTNLVTHSPPSTNWRIGLCNGNLPVAGTPIGDSGFHSLAADDNGNIILDGDVVETWSVPGNGQTAIIEVDLDENLAWFATDAGAYSDPVDISSLRYGNSNSGTYEDNRKFPIFPAISLYHTGDQFSLIADESIFNFVGNVSTDYVPWGGSSCGAALRFDGGEAFDHGAGLFNGDTPPSSLIWRSGLTGAADSKLLTCSLWIKPEYKAGYQVLIGATVAGSLRLEVDIDPSNKLALYFRNNAGTIIVDILSRNYIPVDTWSHILFSLDTNTTNRHLYINDIEAMGTIATYINNAIDFTFTDYWGIGAQPADYNFSYLGAMAELWFEPGTYIDFSVEANRRKFITEFGRPVYLGENGELVTGNSPGDAPLIYLRFQDEASMGTNYGTGGDFTAELIDFATFHTGDFKCFNSRGSCQDPNNFLSDPQLIRFAVPADYLPKEIDCYPSIKDINFTPAILSLGETLGQRATLKVVCNDHPDNDAGPLFDKYIIERSYDAYTQGTFFGKFRARNPFPRGNTIRLVRGFLGDLRYSMSVRSYTIDSIDGPSSDGQFTFIAKDILKYADDDRAQAPLLNSGFLIADITDSDTTLTLSPTGIGDDEYPASGYAAIGGSEIVGFNRTGDVFTTISRGGFNTVAAEHKAQDRVQVCLIYSAEDPAFIISDLLSNYAGIDEIYISDTEWGAETALWLGNVYSAIIAEPTSVKKLINELIEQAALVIWWDDIDQIIRLQVLREIATNADTFDDDKVLLNSLDIKEQPDKKYSQVWTYFAKINPLVQEDQIDNYRSNAILIDSDAERDYGQAIKKIFSRWIPVGGRAVADRLNEVQLGRYRAPPRRFNFDLMCLSLSDYPLLGIGYQLEGWPLQTIFGDRATVPIQITRLDPGETICSVEAEEMQFMTTTADPTTHDITIDFDIANVNLQEMHDSIYSEAVSGDTVNVYISSTVYSNSASSPALIVGTFVAGVDVNIFLDGKIEGAGGDGGTGGTYPGLQHGSPGNPGGTALYTRQAINLTDTSGDIWGGGGGGGGGAVEGIEPSALVGGGGGGGGAGFVAGAAGGRGFGTNRPDGQDGQAGTETTGGLGQPGGQSSSPPLGGGRGGDGGDPGIDGATADNALISGNPGSSGGSNGVAIDGIAFVTTIGGAGDRRGGTI